MNRVRDRAAPVYLMTTEVSVPVLPTNRSLVVVPDPAAVYDRAVRKVHGRECLKSLGCFSAALIGAGLVGVGLDQAAGVFNLHPSSTLMTLCSLPLAGALTYLFVDKVTEPVNVRTFSSWGAPRLSVEEMLAANS